MALKIFDFPALLAYHRREIGEGQLHGPAGPEILDSDVREAVHKGDSAEESGVSLLLRYIFRGEIVGFGFRFSLGAVVFSHFDRTLLPR